MSAVDVLLLAGQVLCVGALTGLVTYGLMVLAGGRPVLQFVVGVAGLVYGIVAGVGIVVVELVVR